jgi:hypothetical protein
MCYLRKYQLFDGPCRRIQIGEDDQFAAAFVYDPSR